MRDRSTQPLFRPGSLLLSFGFSPALTTRTRLPARYISVFESVARRNEENAIDERLTAEGLEIVHVEASARDYGIARYARLTERAFNREDGKERLAWNAGNLPVSPDRQRERRNPVGDSFQIDADRRFRFCRSFRCSLGSSRFASCLICRFCFARRRLRRRLIERMRSRHEWRAQIGAQRHQKWTRSAWKAEIEVHLIIHRIKNRGTR